MSKSYISNHAKEIKLKIIEKLKLELKHSATRRGRALKLGRNLNTLVIKLKLIKYFECVTHNRFCTCYPSLCIVSCIACYATL